jgi:hypothetical protein
VPKNEKSRGKCDPYLAPSTANSAELKKSTVPQ